MLKKIIGMVAITTIALICAIGGGSPAFAYTAEEIDRNVQLDLFDYWLTSRVNDSTDALNSGINSGQTLKFVQDRGSTSQWYNNQNGEYGKFSQGIVKPTLSGGYPVLNVGSGESLSYLFNPSTTHSGKISFPNCKTSSLFSSDSNNNIFFTSTKWYQFNENTKSFSQTGAIDQFFPFSSPSAWNGVANNRTLNHFFGMVTSMNFAQAAGGKTPSGSDMTFNFRGDDDGTDSDQAESDSNQGNTEIDIIEVKHTIYDMPIQLSVAKTDESGEMLSGCGLSVRSYDDATNGGIGEEIDSWISDNQKHVISPIPAGRYVLVENSAADGYDVAEPITFEVKPTTDGNEIVMINKKSALADELVETSPAEDKLPPIVQELSGLGDSKPLLAALAISTMLVIIIVIAVRIRSER